MLDAATPAHPQPVRQRRDPDRARARRARARSALGAPLAAPVAPGHKIAREDIPLGGAVTKFGQVIGYATRPIAAGEHVHSQNCEFGAHDQDYHVGADLAAARAAIPAGRAAQLHGLPPRQRPGRHPQLHRASAPR